MKKRKLYTIGYTLFQKKEGINVDEMFKTLQKLKISHLIDVRSIPYSKQFPQCNENNLKLLGKLYSISYGHMPELGAKANYTQDVFSKASDIFFEDIFPIPKSTRPENIELYANEEIVDFQKFRKNEYFSEGIKRIEKAYENNYTLALMCSEKRPIDCHRFFLISKMIEENFGDWIDVIHITKNKNGEVDTLSNESLKNDFSKIILNKSEIRKLDILNSSFFEPAKINNYFGNAIQDKVIDFCDRYWNLLHGWRMENNNQNNTNEYD